MVHSLQAAIPNQLNAQVNAISANTTQDSTSLNAAIAKPPLRLSGCDINLNIFEVTLESLETLLLVLSDEPGMSLTLQGLPDFGANVNILPDYMARQFASYTEVVCQNVNSPNQLQVESSESSAT